MTCTTKLSIPYKTNYFNFSNFNFSLNKNIVFNILLKARNVYFSY